MAEGRATSLGLDLHCKQARPGLRRKLQRSRSPVAAQGGDSLQEVGEPARGRGQAGLWEGMNRAADDCPHSGGWRPS